MANKTYEEINERIRRGDAVVMTAEEVARMAQTADSEQIAQQVDVVTTGTFAPMCSSGAVLNFGHCSPPIRMEEITLNGVPAHAGLAAVDCYLGATSTASSADRYGGAHVIEDLVCGREVRLEASSFGTDCYPRTRLEKMITADSLNDMFLFNPRNCYQNYAVAVNSSRRALSTYMGRLLPRMSNATYSTSGELSPLLNSPQLRTVGIGTAIFLCGAHGRVVFSGTQSTDEVPVSDRGLPTRGAATLAVIGDMRRMSPRWLRAAHYPGYGVTLFVGLGIPIPMLDADIARAVSISNADIDVEVADYGQSGRPTVARTNYAQLRSGWVRINGKTVRTSSLSSLHRAREIAEELRLCVQQGRFELTAPLAPLPSHSPAADPLGGRDRAAAAGGAESVRQGPLKWRQAECVHCGACTAACTAGARRVDSSSAALVFDEELCCGCLNCANSCPLGVLEFAAGDGHE